MYKSVVGMMVRKFRSEDLPEMVSIWNEVVEAGNAFPQEELLDIAKAGDFFSSQTFSGVFELDGKVVGLYILHPNNIGRCGHLCNASYAVKSGIRGKGIGRELVKHCIKTAGECGYKILQFNAVVKSNEGAIALYEKLGFTRLGTVPGGFLNKSEKYEDIVLFYIQV